MQKTYLSKINFSQLFHQITQTFLKKTVEISTETPKFLAKTLILNYCLKPVAAEKINDLTKDSGHAALAGIIIFATGLSIFTISHYCSKKEKVSSASIDDSLSQTKNTTQRCSAFLILGGLLMTVIFGLMYLISSAYLITTAQNH